MYGKLRAAWGDDLTEHASGHFRRVFRQLAVRALLATGIVSDYLILKSMERLRVHLASLIGVADPAA